MEYEALLSMIACDVEGPEWIETLGEVKSIERNDLTKRLEGPWRQLLQVAEDIRNEWKERSSKEVKRRASREEGRETMRLIMRAWRELM